MLYTGVVENRRDPLKLGRCQIRVVGMHTHDKTALPTSDLPWAYPVQPITSAAISGIGYSPLGLVEGTWVVVMFRDEEQQQPVILGSIGGIPQTEAYSVDQDEDEQISIDSKAQSSSVDSLGNPVPSGQGIVTDSSANIVTDGNGNPVRTGTVNSGSVSQSVNKSTGKIPQASSKIGIEAINLAMDQAGITGKYARAAIQGIVGGESEWIPRSEGYNYTVQGLITTFPKTFANNEALAQKYAKWKGTREDFFAFVYAPENNGSNLGNTQPGDGALYYGRGFLQITGRSNYSRYSRITGIDILARPNLLNEDSQVSAQVAVAFFRDRVVVSQDDPSYFQAALSAVAGARSSWPKKEAYYQYFLGEVSPPAQTDKTTKPGEEVQQVEVSISGIPKDRQKNIIVGFSDPNMKYPLRQYIGEPDTNRLARGRIDGTIVEFKDEKRLENVETANGFTWSQVDIPFNAKYPYNKVLETESGHIMEFDDTPDNERIHFYHRKGSYTEIDANGTRVNRIVGDNYEIVERNGYVYVNGECNVTIGGTARILCQNDAFIQVSGDTKFDLEGEVDINVAKNLNVSVGEEFRLKASNIKIESDSDFNLNVTGSNKQTSSGNLELNATGRANIEGSTVHFAEGAASADLSGIGNPIQVGSKSTQKFDQLKPPPRNLEEEMEYETPEENESEEAKTYHQNRETATTSDKATPVEEAETPDNQSAEIRGSCEIIYSIGDSIPQSYVLHTDSTGYKWTLGAVSRNNTILPIVYRGKSYTAKDIMCNMKGLAENILGPINENIGKVGVAWTITSSYRNNIPIGGSTNSQHLIGCAVDFVCGSNNFAYKLNYDCALKLASILPYDQIILEYRDPGVNGNRNKQRINWIHVSYNNIGPGRKQSLTFLNDKTYKQGFANLASN